ncbi:Uncharacterised protein [Mycobacteroides abscessus subsp. abscessus]|nr:Uncharacterised protein [Mycobacteroides abscessus subsp. abscessus]
MPLSDNTTDHYRATRRLGDVRLTFHLIGVENRLGKCPAEDGGEFPAQIGGITDARRHSLADPRWHGVCGIAG